MASSSSDSEPLMESDPSYEYTQKRKPSRRKPKQVKTSAETANEMQKKYECKGCRRVFRSLASRFIHTSKCQPYIKRKRDLICTWCCKPFASKTALSLHAVKVHGDTSHKNDTVNPMPLNPTEHACHVCNKVFKSNTNFKYHIRRTHFNLVGKAPHAHEKKVNQVWYEKVMNSNNIVEIRKIKDNTLVMKKFNENTAIQVNSDSERFIDVSIMYPTGRLYSKIECPKCSKSIARHQFQKHFNEVHLNLRNYHCNICNKSFKRNYLLLKHPCSEGLKSKSDRDAAQCVDDSSVRVPSEA